MTNGRPTPLMEVVLPLFGPMTDASTRSLQTLLDEREIVQVALRYCRALDTKDWAAARRRLPPRRHGGPVGSRHAARRHRGDPRPDPHRAAATSTTASISSATTRSTVDGDTATHRCYLQAQHIRAAAIGGPNYIVAGRYEDRFVRTDAGWRIAHRTLISDVDRGQHRASPTAADLAARSCRRNRPPDQFWDLWP